MIKKIKNREIEHLSNAVVCKFPKYTASIINQINQTAQGTRPKIVGQMSELIQEFDGQTLEDWTEWYNKRHPDAIENATEKIYEQYLKEKAAMMAIDKDVIREWVKDLVYTKTFCGMKFQQAIISFIADSMGRKWRLATKEEESKGIDGYIGDKPIQIKPSSYQLEGHLHKSEETPIVYYKKHKGCLIVDYNELEFTS